MMDTIKERFSQLQSSNGSSVLTPIEKNAFEAFSRLGIPTVKNEEWKYTRISPLFNKPFEFIAGAATTVTVEDLNAIRLPGWQEANEIVFVNGRFEPQLSNIRSSALVVQSLEEAAANGYHSVVRHHLGHSGSYVKDGMHALNTAFLQEGVFLHIKKGQITEHPVYLYHISDARRADVLSQPRSLVYVEENAQVQIAETYATLGKAEGFTNQVMEIVVEKNAVVDYYKIQNDATHANLVSTTHFRQVGTSQVHAVTISLNGNIIRNNLNVVLEADHCESHLYGLYFLKGQSHVDNHTVVDNRQPHCLSNELYKGVIDDHATAVFNGKILVEPLAQKTNAFQSNKNILLSDTATVNTKPQLEIFADDVKCSHGCTVGQLDEEGLFYLRSRGVNEKTARSLLVHAFALDILERIKPEALRQYVDGLISERLEFSYE